MHALTRLALMVRTKAAFAGRPFAVSCGLAVLAAAHASAQAPTFANVMYANVHPRNVLDVYIPATPAGPKPCVVWIHGGGWQNGDKSSATSSGKVNELLSRGFVVVSINYRLSQHAIFPAQIHDCKGAIRFIRARAAQFQIDPTRLGVWGSSAGGHLVALLGTSGDVPDAEGTVGGNLLFSSRVNAVADYFGPTDFFEVDGWGTACTTPPTAMHALLGACLGEIQMNVGNPNPPWPEKVALAQLAGATTHVTPDDPPFYIAHGTADGTVWPEHSELLHAGLVAAGVPSTLRLVPGAGHGLPQSENQAVYNFFVAELGTFTPCPPDVNRDGELDFSDIEFFLALYAAGDPRADFNRDMELDFSDIETFLGQYALGCD